MRGHYTHLSFWGRHCPGKSIQLRQWVSRKSNKFVPVLDEVADCVCSRAWWLGTSQHCNDQMYPADFSPTSIVPMDQIPVDDQDLQEFTRFGSRARNAYSLVLRKIPRLS